MTCQLGNHGGINIHGECVQLEKGRKSARIYKHYSMVQAVRTEEMTMQVDAR